MDLADKRIAVIGLGTVGLPLGIVPDSFSDNNALEAAVGWRPSTPMMEGMNKFLHWYLAYFGMKAHA